MRNKAPRVRVTAALRVWQRNATVYKRTWKLNILPNFFEPFLYLLGMGLGLGAYITEMEGMPYINFIAPGLLISSIMWGATLETTYNVFVKMNFDRIYDASSPRQSIPRIWPWENYCGEQPGELSMAVPFYPSSFCLEWDCIGASC